MAGTSKEYWVSLVTKLADEYYEEEEEHGVQTFSKESMEEDETGDVFNDAIEDFALWITLGGWK